MDKIWYKVVSFVGIPKEEYNDWDSQCDEVNVALQIHNPENNIYVYDYERVSIHEVIKDHIFDEYGGI